MNKNFLVIAILSFSLPVFPQTKEVPSTATTATTTSSSTNVQLASKNNLEDSILGEWVTIDDKSNEERAVIEIYQVQDKYFGKIAKTFPKPGDKDICDKCEGDDKNKPIVGLEILKNVEKLSQKKDDLTYGKGTILDPENGHRYKVNLEVIDQGARLKVRGYIGFSLIGRTQVWKRRDALPQK